MTSRSDRIPTTAFRPSTTKGDDQTTNPPSRGALTWAHCLGLMLGLGLLLILRAFTTPPVTLVAVVDGRDRTRLTALLRAAGIENVTAAGLVSLCAHGGRRDVRDRARRLAHASGRAGVRG